jgi:hypothetical protein
MQNIKLNKIFIDPKEGLREALQVIPNGNIC